MMLMNMGQQNPLNRVSYQDQQQQQQQQQPQFSQQQTRPSYYQGLKDNNGMQYRIVNLKLKIEPQNGS